jgi:peptidoglycan/xylan/chitin deacetylase (PgdA/CDA1 family)
VSAGTVCLTFDFDAVSLWIMRGLTHPGPMSRGEFGAEAVPRILRLLDSRGLGSTWFIPGHTIESFPHECEQVVAAGHEIGLHGYAHENVEQLDRETEQQVLARSFELVRDLIGRPPMGNRTPSWTFSPNTVELLLDQGLVYDSSLMATDYRPYRCRRADVVTTEGPLVRGDETPLIEIPVSWSLDDYPAFEYVRTSDWLMPGLRRPDEVFANWLDDVKYMTRDFDDGVCVLTFHPQVIGRGHRMLGLERFLDELEQLGVRFARLDAVASDFRTGRRFGAPAQRPPVQP